jgi:hypothetical protein
MVAIDESQKSYAIEYADYNNAENKLNAGLPSAVALQNTFKDGIDYYLKSSPIALNVKDNGNNIEKQISRVEVHKTEMNFQGVTEANNHISDASTIITKKENFVDALNTIPSRNNRIAFSKKMTIADLDMDLIPTPAKQFTLHELPHFFMNVSLGMNIHSDLLGLHKPEHGYDAIYRFGVQKNKISLSTGIEYRILVEQFDYKNDKTVLISNALTNQYVNVLTNDTTSVYGQANATVTRTVVHHNQYRYLDVPLMANYDLIKHNKVRFGIGLGLRLGRLVSQSGRYNLNENVENFDNTNGFLKNSFEMNFMGELYTSYTLNDGLYLISRIHVTTIGTKRHSDQVSVNSILGSGTLGVGYRF